jgi:hypothetical protein
MTLEIWAGICTSPFDFPNKWVESPICMAVNSMEEENRRKKVDWLEERLTQRDEKIDGLYIELRKEQEEKINWIHKCHEVELIQKESEVKKCEIRGCVKRMPPSDY